MTQISSDIDRAAEIIEAGGLVGFPTETVYGLGANALDAEAVERIFEAKRRPKDNPIIVHVSGIEMARELAESWGETATALSDQFWPGPLTLVVPKVDRIPDLVTAGLETVGLRAPSHPVAQKLVERAGVPVAAPSANRFQGVSPTRARHVVSELEGDVDLVLEGGATNVGIESTVLSIAHSPPRLLRPGMISLQQLHEHASQVSAIEVAEHSVEGAKPSPGMSPRHYAPSAKLEVIDAPLSQNNDLPSDTGYLLCREASPNDDERMLAIGANPEEYARNMYAGLRQLDSLGCQIIAVESPPTGTQWGAIRDRLSRATGGEWPG